MKVAIITGASRGIGACVAKGLAADGFATALVARSKDSLAQVAKEIEAAHAKDKLPVKTFAVDVSDHNAVQETVASVLEIFGRVDFLFNNAGVAHLGTTEVSIEEFDQTLAINLRGAFSFLKAVVPVMKKQKSGTIVNVSSRAGRIGFAGYGVYGASKFGLVGLSESLYRELSPLGIKVTALCPSWVDTDMAKYSGLPAKEMLQAEDILSTVRWLLALSPAAAVKDVSLECRKQID